MKLPKLVGFQIILAQLSSNEEEGRIKFQCLTLKQSTKPKSIVGLFQKEKISIKVL